jgi:hypothetical protein
MPVKSKGALSLLGSRFDPERKNSLESIGQWFKPLDFHRVFYKIDNLARAYLCSSRLSAGNLIAEPNVFGWLRLN